MGMQIKSPLPKQTKDIYSLLLRRGQLNAEQIGKELDIFPHAVYRSIDQLKSLGCVNQLGKHPAFFAAQPVNESVEIFTLLQREWFLRAFLESRKKNNAFDGEQLNITFIESREMMFEISVEDMEKTNKEFCLFISGDEKPAEVTLAQNNLIKRGVVIKTLAQRRDSENEQMLQSMKRAGEEVRIHPVVNARILIFDRHIVYVTSYDPTNHLKSTGIRFEYAPLGQLMHGLFMHYWEQGKEL